MTDHFCAGRAVLRSLDDLARAGLIASDQVPALAAVAERFSVAVTPVMAGLIDPTDASDPIARQFVPDAAELIETDAERADPIGDRTHSPVRGIVHRYPDRVLLTPTPVCAVYCRFCFRREAVGPNGAALDGTELDGALAYIADRPAIREVILSGGDPLILSPRRLGEIVTALDRMAHVEVIRIHTRVPLVDPARITPELVAALTTETAVWVVVHANHPTELTSPGKAACRRLVAAGIPLLAQSVLLKGVNDDVETLTGLFRGLVAMRIKPYYLHHGDLARGTGHFRTTLSDGQALMRALRGRVSGLCQPTYVLDVPGGHGKVPVGPSWAAQAPGADGTTWLITDPDGRIHEYL